MSHHGHDGQLEKIFHNTFPPFPIPSEFLVITLFMAYYLDFCFHTFNQIFEIEIMEMIVTAPYHKYFKTFYTIMTAFMN